MKTIKYNGQEVEAYSLIMTKANALDILNGKKVIEARKLSSKYEKMFTNFKQLEENERLRKEGRENECQPILRTDIEAIHFYSTGAPWFLDVAIDEIGIGEVTEEGIKFMHEEFDFHDFDEQLEEFKKNPPEEIPLFYYLHISEVINHEGLK
ncbi:hypothetical protein DWY45_01950 [Phocaeicola plebeius]|jgi:hypothetical protein|uniref:ASCH domain-containing protein n=1 Tax=Phocaeicola plebeius TaxID=310297 RepID=A0A414RJK7_9BACT|nr:hypothetical protein [Phocaeicola plebeius]RGQ74745.1 hypothetical protein DWY86_05095 [Phocaeicola plebeius]RGQ93982.1 hypothetical protein DWY72_05410 [Phocaeicola plebeius]RGR57660.1 hypothetical protein DWY45_01950 [Phocaeicola plebeius]RHF93365.1 hypothetical protein DW653_00390 [Phocaeicola plebeius]